jgi:hypothetical protein
MNEKPKQIDRARESQMRLIALLLFVADQRQKSIAMTEQLLSRLMLPGKH